MEKQAQMPHHHCAHGGALGIGIHLPQAHLGEGLRLLAALCDMATRTPGLVHVLEVGLRTHRHIAEKMVVKNRRKHACYDTWAHTQRTMPQMPIADRQKRWWIRSEGAHNKKPQKKKNS